MENATSVLIYLSYHPTWMLPVLLISYDIRYILYGTLWDIGNDLIVILGHTKPRMCDRFKISCHLWRTYVLQNARFYRTKKSTRSLWPNMRSRNKMKPKLRSWGKRRGLPPPVPKKGSSSLLKVSDHKPPLFQSDLLSDIVHLPLKT